MKKLLILFVLPLLVFACSEGEKKEAETTDVTDSVEMQRSDWANEHMLGEVKYFEQTPYTPDEAGNIGKMDSCCVQREEYNKDGFMMKETKKDATGKVTEVGMMERTETGKFMTYTRTENGKEVFKRVVKRNAEGESIEAVDTDSTQQVQRIHKPEEMNEYEQPLKGQTYMSDNTYLGTWSWDYIDGQRVGNAWVDSSGVQLVKRVGEVNDKGLVSKVVDTRIEESGDTITVVETYTYDSFDETGNWTQRTEYHDGEPVEVLKRTYAYYAN